MKRTLAFVLTGVLIIFAGTCGAFADESFYASSGQDPAADPLQVPFEDPLASFTFEHREVLPKSGTTGGTGSRYASAPGSAYVPPPVITSKPVALPASSPASSEEDLYFQPAYEVETPVAEPPPANTIRDHVRALREERLETMPFLDRGYIRGTINEDYVSEKIEFIESGQKSLQDLINRAIRMHTPTRAARERISLANRRILSALRAMFPEMEYELESRDGKLSEEFFGSTSYRVTLRQPLFHGGALWNTVRQEYAGMKAAKKEYEGITEDVVRDVAQAYFDYNRAFQVTHDQANAIIKMNRYSEISQEKHREGLISEIENLNVESLYSQMTYDHETGKQELELAKLDLQNLLALDIEDDFQVASLYDVENLLNRVDLDGSPDPLFEGTSEEFGHSAEIPDLKELVDMAYRSRAELQVESAQLESARLEERIQWGDLMPRADLIIEFGKLGEAFLRDDRDPGLKTEYRLFLELNWNTGVASVNYQFERNETAPSISQFLSGAGTDIDSQRLKVGLFDGLDAIARVKEAEVAKLDQIVELENTEKEVVQEVKQAYYDYQKAVIQVKSTLKRLDYRQRLAQLAEHRLGQNEIQISEYMQAEIDLTQERSELHQALADYFTAKAELNRAVGVRNYLPIEETYGE